MAPRRRGQVLKGANAMRGTVAISPAPYAGKGRSLRAHLYRQPIGCWLQAKNGKSAGDAEHGRRQHPAAVASGGARGRGLWTSKTSN